MKKSFITCLKIIIPLGIGLYLTWFFISNLSISEQEDLKNAFVVADYSFIFYSIIMMLLSHMSRAYRWKYMLKPLGHEPKFWTMYHSVMIGYLLNLTIPRSGEVARAGYYAKFEKRASFDKVFGTIIVERFIDMIMLGLVFSVTIYLQKDIAAFNEIKETGQDKSSVPAWISYVYYALGGLMVFGAIALFISNKLKEKVLVLIKGVWEGVKTIFKLKQRFAYIGHTLFIWACYIGMIWVCSFTLPETANLSVNAVFAAFVVGAVAISATPGGIGLYPLMVSAVLIQLYGIENAGSFSMLAWTALTLFTIILGLVSLVALPFISNKST